MEVIMWTKWGETTDPQQPRPTPVHFKTHHGWVTRCKIRMQENRNPYLHHRNFIPGESVIVNESMNNDNYKLLISKRQFKEVWSRFELKKIIYPFWCLQCNHAPFMSLADFRFWTINQDRCVGGLLEISSLRGPWLGIRLFVWLYTRQHKFNSR